MNNKIKKIYIKIQSTYKQKQIYKGTIINTMYIRYCTVLTNIIVILIWDLYYMPIAHTAVEVRISQLLT